MRFTVYVLALAVLGAIGQSPPPSMPKFRTSTFHYGPSSADGSDIIRVRLGYLGQTDAEYIALPHEARLALVEIKGPDSWVPRVRTPAAPVDSAPGHIMKRGDTLELLIPLTEFFERYELDSEGQPLVLTIPIPLGGADGRIRFIRVMLRMTIYATPEDWTCNVDPKRVLESYYRRLGAGVLDAARQALPSTLSDEDANARMNEARTMLTNPEGAVMILDSKTRGDDAVVFMRVVEGTTVHPQSAYFRRVEGCWRIVDAPPENEGIRKLFEAWVNKALQDYFLAG